MAQHLPHSLQLSLFVLIGRLELLHPLRQVLHLRLLPLPELSAPQPGLTVRRQQTQPQQLDARLDSCRETGTRGESDDHSLYLNNNPTVDAQLSQQL